SGAWVLATQPFVGNSEVNLRYLDAVEAHKAMADYIAAHNPRATVLTQWPHTAELDEALLGYVARPILTKVSAKPADLDASDLVVVSSLATHSNELRSLAERHDWPVAHTVRRGDVEVVLYARPRA